MQSEKNELLKQINTVIDIIEKRLKTGSEKIILNTIYTRYINARRILINKGDISKIMISGGCRAYLDSYSDYTNPILDDMYKAEKIFEELKDTSKYLYPPF